MIPQESENKDRKMPRFFIYLFDWLISRNIIVDWLASLVARPWLTWVGIVKRNDYMNYVAAGGGGEGGPEQEFRGAQHQLTFWGGEGQHAPGQLISPSK